MNTLTVTGNHLPQGTRMTADALDEHTVVVTLVLPALREPITIHLQETPGKSMEPYTCPTLCDEDCGAFCHEGHQPKYKQRHDASACIQRGIQEQRARERRNRAARVFVETAQAKIRGEL